MPDIDELRRLLERLDEVDPVPWVVLENGKIGTPNTPANTDTNREDEVNELRKQFTVAMRNSAGQLLDAADEVTHLRSRVAELEAKLTEAREVVRPLIEWLEREGRIENHGHRRPRSNCAECGVVNRAAAWLRGQEE